MAAIVTTLDGQYIYFALEDSAGLPLVMREAREAPGTFSTVYEPGAGTAVNVATIPGEYDYLLFYGNFGTDVGLILHTVSDTTNTDITPTTIGAAVINAAAAVDISVIFAAVSTAQDLYLSDDGGGNWTAQNAAIGLDATAMLAMDLEHLFVCGNTGAQTNILYSSDAGVTLTDEAIAAIHSAANICAIEKYP